MRRRVPASESVPRLGKRREARLRAADDKSAEGYEALEDATEMVAALARDIRSEVITIDLKPPTDPPEGVG